MNIEVPPPALRHSRSPDEVPLALSAEEFRTAGHRLVDRIAELLAGLPDRPVTPGQGPETVRDKLKANASLPSKGQEASAVLGSVGKERCGVCIQRNHPRQVRAAGLYRELQHHRGRCR